MCFLKSRTEHFSFPGDRCLSANGVYTDVGGGIKNDVY